MPCCARAGSSICDGDLVQHSGSTASRRSSEASGQGFCALRLGRAPEIHPVLADVELFSRASVLQILADIAGCEAL